MRGHSLGEKPAEPEKRKRLTREFEGRGYVADLRSEGIFEEDLGPGPDAAIGRRNVAGTPLHRLRSEGRNEHKK
jgi:hypothetical protein